MRSDNRGLSLVELVIVITIMVVVGGMMTMGISAAFSKPADECAKKIETALNNARVTTMGKQSIVLELYQKDDYVYLKETVTDADGSTSVKDLRIGAKYVAVEYKLAGDTAYNPLGDASNPLTLSFKRTTGGFNTLPGGGYCDEIKVSKGSKIRLVKLAYLTGKVTVE